MLLILQQSHDIDIDVGSSYLIDQENGVFLRKNMEQRDSTKVTQLLSGTCWERCL